MTAFCAEHGISRKTFYVLLGRARAGGPATALEPRSRRPRTSPSRISDEAKEQALRVRGALERSGLDHGPISVFEKMKSMGLEPVPSVASLARIFRQSGVARLEPRKKPRAAYRRWQLDATEYVLTGGRKCVIFQLIDDHSRFAVASHVAAGETSEAAIAVVKKGITAHGVPQKLLTDNGAALNPSRRGHQGQLLTCVTSLGIEAVTGKPYKPTTQGKNERFHQTLFRFLDKQPLARTIEQLQEQVGAFDQLYNTERPHQGLPGRITPRQAWAATPVAEPPHPKPVPALTQDRTRGSGQATRIAYPNGRVTINSVVYMIGRPYARHCIHALWDTEMIQFFDDQGTHITSYPCPPAGTKSVGNGKPPGRTMKQPPTVTEVLTHDMSPIS
ncbi:Integrase, catalytic region [Arthrobacter sp. FB24]|nr:IS481-like element ISArsp2 family transposase [Arthrobacter sp. FB24]ABK03232.1 Integrase, catalytic region [Arthrobacter sp. FB24]